MAYLTFAEYQALGFKRIASEADFEKAEPDAEALFDSATNGYYLVNDLGGDPNTSRVKLFKKALALECEFINDTGAGTSYEVAQQNVKTVSVGRTSISTDSSLSSSLDAGTGLYQLAYRILAQTGLLYRGVGSDEYRRQWL